MNILTELFNEHLKIRTKDADHALQALGYNGLILSSGDTFTYFEDDMDADFRSNPHFAHWCPAKGPKHLIKYTPGKKPLLLYYSPEDFWHIHERLSSPYWANSFEIVEFGNTDKILSLLGDISGYVFLGNDTKPLLSSDVKINCQFMTARMNWKRRTKSNYEIHCISEANKKASIGHLAAKIAFFEGASEYEIHMKYLQAMNEVDANLPYCAIVGLDKNSAILHYHGRELKKNGHVLLIDSGASYMHYAADITRTYATQACNTLFLELIDKMNVIQQKLCNGVKAGSFYPDLHLECHKLIGQMLIDTNIIKKTETSDNLDYLIEEGVVKTFFPHGLGHMLGVQVHDIGGKQLDEQGNIAPALTKNVTYKSLRYLGTLEEGNVITIEPGIYFIPLLLNELKNNTKLSKYINWDLVEKLIPCGGIRIEDEVLATKNGPRNLTREYLP